MAGPTKKGKTASKGKSLKGKESKPKELRQSQSHQDEFGKETMVAPQERVQAVRPFWETQPQEERVQLLTASLDALRERGIELAIRQRKQAAQEEAELAAEIAAGAEPIPGTPLPPEPTIDEVLEEGLSRLQNKPTWKLWNWTLDGQEFYDADSFRQHVEENHLDEALRRLLPRDEGRPVEKPAEEALRKRMTELLQKVHQNTRQLQDEVTYTKRMNKGQRATSDQIHTVVRDTNIELITIILQALEQEHEFLYHAVLFPVTGFVCEMLPEGSRDSGRAELFFEDLEKLVPEDVARICEWLTEKVDGFSAKLKPEAKEIQEEEENGIGDVDLFTLSEDKTEVTVNSKWLQHLQERLLGEDGHPRKVQDSEDPHHMGLVLEWVYGTIVSTAEKARDSAKRALGVRPPSAQQAHDLLVSALQDQAGWESRAQSAKELLNHMMKSRRDAALLGQTYDIKPTPTTPPSGSDSPPDSIELPDSVIEAMLRRELLLTNAKLHGLGNEHITSERKLRSLRTQLRQGEPGFERLKRELEEVKNAPRGLEGTFRTAAEMERHRAQAADAAIEEQLEVQTAFREHGARLQGIYEHKQRTEHDIARREQEMKQLQGWKATVTALMDKFARVIQAVADENVHAPTANGDDSGRGTESENVSMDLFVPRTNLRSTASHERAKIRMQFHKEVRRQLYSDKDDLAIYSTIQSQLKLVDKRLADGRAALQHLEMGLINVACDDPGAAIGAHLILPLLQDRLDAQAMKFADKRAVEAEEDIIRMEALKLEQAAAERDRRLKAKQKNKERARSEKERAAAERDAQVKADAEAAVVAAQERVEAEHSEKQRKLAEAEAARAEQEALMEARRLELLQEKDGYWSKRMAAEEQAHAAELAETQAGAPSKDDDGADSNASESTSWREDPESDPATSRRQRTRPDSRGPGQGRYSLANGYAPHVARTHSGSRRSGEEDGLRGNPRRGGPARRGTVPGQRLGISRSSSSISDRSVQSDMKPERRAPTSRPTPTHILVIPKSALVQDSNKSDHQQQHTPQQQQQQQQRAAVVQQVPVSSKPVTPTTPARQESATSPSAEAAADVADEDLGPPTPAGQPEAAPAAADAASSDSSLSAEAQPEAAAESGPPHAAPSSHPDALPLQFGSVPALTPGHDLVSLPASHANIGSSGQGSQMATIPLPLPLAIPLHAGEPGQPNAGMQQPQQQLHSSPGMPLPGPLMQSSPSEDLAGMSRYQQLPGQGVHPLSAPQPTRLGMPQHGMPPKIIRDRSGEHGAHMNGLLPHAPSNLPVMQPLSRNALPAGSGGIRPPRMPQGLGSSPSAAIHQNMRSSGSQPPLPEGSDVGHMHSRQSPGLLNGDIPQRGPGQPNGPGAFPGPAHPLTSPPRLPSGAQLKPFPGGPTMNGPLRSPNSLPKAQLMNGPGSPSSSMGTYMSSRHQMVPAYMPGGPVGAPLSHLPMGMLAPGPYQPPGGMGPHMHPGQLAMSMAMGMAPGHGMAAPGTATPLLSPRSGNSAPLPMSSRSSSGSLPQPQNSAKTTLRATALPFIPGASKPAPVTPFLPALPNGNGLLEPLHAPQPADAASQLQLSGSSSAQPQAPRTSCGHASETRQPDYDLTAARPAVSLAEPDEPLPGVSSQSQHSAPSTSLQADKENAQQQQQQHHQRITASREATTSQPQVLHMRGLTSSAGDKRKITRTGGVVWDGLGDDLKRLALVRGLRNDTGLNNCFLNVVIQSLWHLRPFRQALLALDLEGLEQAGNRGEKDVRVLRALRNIFDAFATPLEADAASLADAANADGFLPDGEASTKRAKHDSSSESSSRPSSRGGWTVSPSELRAALSSLGKAAIQFDLSEMHDAAEVLGEIFTSLHMAEAGSAAEGAADPQLPVCLRVPSRKAKPLWQRSLPRSTVLDLFGLQVQVDAPAPSDEPASISRRSKGSLGAAPVGIWQEVPVRTSSPHAAQQTLNGHAQSQPSSPAADAPARDASPPGIEVLQFVKFCHLLPAQSLRAALHRMSGSSSFEDLLRGADTNEASVPRSAALPELLPISLLRRPDIFTLAVVWESLQSSTQTISAMVDALSQQVDLGRVFRDVPSGPAYQLRCVICYFSHHYQAFALSEELNQWLLFDDTHIKQIGPWQDAAAVMKSGRLQPSLLFYEQL